MIGNSFSKNHLWFTKFGPKVGKVENTVKVARGGNNSETSILSFNIQLQQGYAL